MHSRLNCDPTAETEYISTHFGIYIPAHKYMAITFSWCPPPPGWVKCNSDGSLTSDRAGHGALVRDSTGNFVVGEAAQVPLASINHLELMGVKQGICLCIQRHFRKVIIETDSSTVCAWIQGQGLVPWRSKRVFLETMDLLDSLDEWSIQHVYREANVPGDLLAARMTSPGCSLFFPHTVWTKLAAALLRDRAGPTFTRILHDPSLDQVDSLND
ncbi:hypothetical protein QJS10_CPB15g01175 [Acorus calamus]|uniref:RNase H type-1 domain-containing protein n=1 Tax=Acorus calamus TaxID=4465 RepID=A0AAV9D770_ACOCL|nr:hypothetical protein QJS10_CPB15g01175 [Acorus calamus]